VNIRPALATDASPIAALLGELGYVATEAQVRERLTSAQPTPTLNLVAESGGEVIACLNACVMPYFPNGSTLCRIVAMVVAADRRSKGVGAALVEAAAAYAREQGCSALEVTSADRRSDAHRFYQRSGFTRTSLRFVRAL